MKIVSGVGNIDASISSFVDRMLTQEFASIWRLTLRETGHQNQTHLTLSLHRSILQTSLIKKGTGLAT
jgi:hypothetical protein